MIDDERIHREIDGLLSPAESARLQEELRTEPEARLRYEALWRLQSALASLPPAEPPPGLTGQIMRAIRARALPAPRRPPWGEAVRAALFRQPVLGLGAALAAGLVLGAFLAGVGEPVRLDGKSGATMLPTGALDLREVDRSALAGEGYAGVAVSRATSGRVEVRVHLEGLPPRDLVATFNPDELEALGFDLEGAPAGQVVLSPGSLHVQDARAGDYVLRLGIRRPITSRVQIRLGGQTGVESALKVTEGS